MAVIILVVIYRKNQRSPEYKFLMSLTWESTYAIAMELRRLHPDIDFQGLSLKQIFNWTVQLKEFDDDPSMANDEILYAIYQDWFEENIHDK